MSEHGQYTGKMIPETVDKVVLGDGQAILYRADCRVILPTLGKVDAVVTDPPYAIPTQVASGRIHTKNIGDLTIVEAGFRLYFDAIAGALKSEGHIFIFGDGTSYPVMFRVLYNDFPIALLVWAKGQIGMGREFRKSHELILHAWRTGTPIFSDGVGRSDVITIPPVPNEVRTHPAEKPVDLILELLRVCGDTILDPFMGSGTTGVACARLGRKFIGIEIEDKYFKIAVERISAELAQGKLEF